ncbi:choline kinase [Clostridium novyi A str. 4540]|uniref:choline kinase family protein n=2 Tax=Clostridium novyi TaxID=1542 RepID=UPI0004DAAB45|nr:choline kinase family protein [Clostridium novyi]KEH88681.1 choline kinase [Clostridium novyi A str. 4540]
MLETKKFLYDNQLIAYFLKNQYGQINRVTKIGGMTNTNYKVDFDNKSLVIRIPQNNTKKMINRVDEKINSYLAYKSNVDESFLFIDDLSGIKISNFLGEGQMLTPESAKKFGNMKIVIQLLKKLHSSNIEFNNIFNPFDMIQKYEDIFMEQNGQMFEGYMKLKKDIFRYKSILQTLDIKLVPCHNDTVPENFILNNGKLNLIDWEYSGMNDYIWDLAAHILECGFSEKEEKQFLNLYFCNQVVSDNTIFRINLYKVMQDLLWSIWTKIKMNQGEDLKEYFEMRYKRVEIGLKCLKL